MKHNKTLDKLEWHVVQVDWDLTEHRKAKKLGEYHCKFLVRYQRDSNTKPTKNCKYWPLIYELRANDTLGAMIVTTPDKVDNLLRRNPHTRAWYELKINLAEDGLVGPFNFGKERTIPEEAWKALREEATTIAEEDNKQLDVTDLDRIIPLN